MPIYSIRGRAGFTFQELERLAWVMAERDTILFGSDSVSRFWKSSQFSAITRPSRLHHKLIWLKFLPSEGCYTSKYGEIEANEIYARTARGRPARFRAPYLARLSGGDSDRCRSNGGVSAAGALARHHAIHNVLRGGIAHDLPV